MINIPKIFLYMLPLSLLSPVDIELLYVLLDYYCYYRHANYFILNGDTVFIIGSILEYTPFYLLSLLKTNLT
jgi:hypothetical protein